MVQWVIKTRNKVRLNVESQVTVLYGSSNTHTNDNECTTKLTLFCLNKLMNRYEWFIHMNTHIDTSTQIL